MDKRNFYIAIIVAITLLIIGLLSFTFSNNSPKFEGDFTAEERQSVISLMDSRLDIYARDLTVRKESDEYSCDYPGFSCNIRKNPETSQLEICICSECSECFR